MSERLTPVPEMAVEEKEGGLREKLQRARAKYQELKDLAANLGSDKEVQEGSKAAARTIVNTLISIGDAFPGVGEIPSWGADAAKLWTKWRHGKNVEKKAKELQEEGMSEQEAIEKAKEEVEKGWGDLTPDVKWQIAVYSEVLEVFLGFLPTHSIESVLQLRADWPRLKDGFNRAREILKDRAEISVETQEAMAVIDVKFETKE